METKTSCTLIGNNVISIRFPQFIDIFNGLEPKLKSYLLSHRYVNRD